MRIKDYFTRIKTLVNIVEDSPSYRQTLVDLINDTDHFETGVVCSSAEEILDQVIHLSGIAIIDIKLPGMNGANLVWKISQANKQVQCIICSMYDDDEFIFSALKNGALGYLLKDSTGEQIIAALESLLDGGSPMSPFIARRVIASFQDKPAEPVVKEAPVSELLSDREQQVLQFLAKGLIYKEIAEHLYISHETVKQHIKHIYQKLHVQNKIEALNRLHSR
jgi:DNA-binding NarL/FixJ family response regulator